MKHVIIGVGAAGITAAKTIRDIRPEDDIMMISTDSAVHSRCMLHKYISHERDEEGLNFTEETFFQQNRIEWLQGKSVQGVVPLRKEVILGNERVRYDKLLLAVGAESVIPPIGELKKASNVYGLRHLSDAKKIDYAADKGEQSVIIGSGLVGLDAAYALLERGKKVTIVEMADQILPLQLDSDSAAIYQDKFIQAGCTFQLGSRVTDTVTKDGSVIAVKLDNGKELPCNFVVAAAGVRPNLAFLEGSGMDCDGYILVNEYLESSITDIYAAGDVTGLSGIWPNAMKQGKTAAENMCGMKTAYEDKFAAKNTMNFFGIPSLSLGMIRIPEEDSELYDEIIQKDIFGYRKIVLKQNIVVGVILQGDISYSGIWQYLIKNKINIEKYRDDLFNLSFAQFYGIQKNGEYSWSV